MWIQFLTLIVRVILQHAFTDMDSDLLCFILPADLTVAYICFTDQVDCTGIYRASKRTVRIISVGQRYLEITEGYFRNTGEYHFIFQPRPFLNTLNRYLRPKRCISRTTVCVIRDTQLVTFQFMIFQPSEDRLAFPHLFCEHAPCDISRVVKRYRKECVSLDELDTDPLFCHIRFEYQSALCTSVFNVPSDVLQHLCIGLL